MFAPRRTGIDVRSSEEHARKPGSAHLRFVLGMSQMAAAVVAVILLVQLGVTAASLIAVVVASTLSAVSVMMFGGHRDKN
jgi:hypothetical protein